MRTAFVYDLVYPYSKGGVEKRIWDLAHLFAARGHEVHVLGTKYWDGQKELLVDGIHYWGVCPPMEIHSKDGRRSIWQAARFAYSVARALKRTQFDVVDLQGMVPLTCLAALAVCQFTGRTPVITWHEVWQDHWRAYLGPFGYVGRLVEWLMSRWAPVHFAVSRSTASRLTSWGVAPVSWLSNGVDYQRIQSVPPSSLSCEILYVGRLARHKNLDLLINAVGLLKNEGMDPSVLIVGEGPEMEALQHHAKSEGLDNVRFLGRLEDDDRVFALMKSARLFAFPSLREGFGVAALEASAAGLPVVTITHPLNAAVEFVEDGVTGLCVSPSAEEFAGAIREILTNDELRSTLSNNARLKALDFDWPRLFEKTEREYARVSSLSESDGTPVASG
ncbi:MAG: glycosyltransferase family 4 protein [Acidimicrobiia bacterium]